MTLQRIEAGSVKLILEGSPEGRERILTLFNEGKLTEVLGIPVQGVEVLAQEQAIAPSAGFRIAPSQSQVLIESTRTVADDLAKYWHLRLAMECPKQSIVNRESIVHWLLGSDRTRFDTMSSKDLDIAKQAMECEWQILQQRYLGKGRDAAYRNLMSRLASLVTLRNKIQTWISLSRDTILLRRGFANEDGSQGHRKRSVLDVLQEIIQELLQSDNYMLAQMASIQHLRGDSRLKDALLFASVEEYCLRPIRNQPLLEYRFVNYLRRLQRGGLTQVPGSDLVKLVSSDILTDDNDNSVNLVESQAIVDSQEAQNLLEEQQTLQIEVQQQFENYLRENQQDKVPKWLEMYLAV